MRHARPIGSLRELLAGGMEYVREQSDSRNPSATGFAYCSCFYRPFPLRGGVAPRKVSIWLFEPPSAYIRFVIIVSLLLWWC